MTAERLDFAALAPAWQRARLWWSERSAREQVLLGALAATGIAALLLVAVVAPLRAVRADARADIRNASLLEARLRTGGAGLGQAGRFREGTGSAIVTDSASAARLTIQRIEPAGTDTRVVLADAPFDQVVRWIAEIEQTSRLRTRQVRIERKAAAGMVSATIVFSG